jgi:hypothetical protein
VFSNSPCRETPKNALKKKKKKVRTYFFLRAGADVRRFLGVFFLSPLAWGLGIFWDFPFPGFVFGNVFVVFF